MSHDRSHAMDTLEIIEDLINDTDAWKGVNETIRLTLKAIAKNQLAHQEMLHQMEALMASRASKNEVNAALSLKANVADVSSIIDQISKAMELKVDHSENQDILKNYVLKEELELFDLSNKKNPEDNNEQMDERIFELDNKIEEYCNGIIEQFDKVAPKED